jgi:glutamate-1-semialdehyde 2,1-aminomutase
MIDRGVMLEPDSREPWFLCEAHQTLDLDWFAQVTRDAIAHALKT